LDHLFSFAGAKLSFRCVKWSAPACRAIAGEIFYRAALRPSPLRATRTCEALGFIHRERVAGELMPVLLVMTTSSAEQLQR
jgi:hypothetical protein